MPIIRITTQKGASPAQINTLFYEVTEAVHRTLGAPRENVRIMLNELPAKNLARGGQTDQEWYPPIQPNLKNLHVPSNS